MKKQKHTVKFGIFLPYPGYECSSFWPSLLPAVSVVEKTNNTTTTAWRFWTSHLEKKSAAWSKVFLFCFLQVYTRLPGQQITVNVTLFLCSFNIGTNAEWLMPTVESPLTATIISPHLGKEIMRKKSGRVAFMQQLLYYPHTAKYNDLSYPWGILHPRGLRKVWKHTESVQWMLGKEFHW